MRRSRHAPALVAVLFAAGMAAPRGGWAPQAQDKQPEITVYKAPG